MEGRDNRGGTRGTADGTSDDNQRRMRPSLYYDESEMTLSPNSVSAYGHLLTAAPTVGPNSPPQLQVSPQRKQSHATTSMIAPITPAQSSQKPSFSSSAPGWLEQQNSRTSMSAMSVGSSLVTNRRDIIRYSSYKSDLMAANHTNPNHTKQLKTCNNPWKNKDPYQHNLLLQVVIVLMSFCYWCCSILTILSWYRLVHTSFYLDFLEGVDVELSCSLSLVSGVLGATSSALMFFFAVKPLRVRRSPEAVDQLQTITIILMFSIGIALCALIFSASVQQLFVKHDIIADFDGNVKQEYMFENEFEKLLMKGVKTDYKEEFGRSPNNRFWDIVQFQLGCCGVYNQRDWLTSDFANRSLIPFPVTCCTQLSNYFDGAGSFVFKVYESSTFPYGYKVQIKEALNQTCYREQRITNFKGCGESISTFYEYLVDLFLVLNLVMFFLSFVSVVLLPVAL